MVLLKNLRFFVCSCFKVNRFIEGKLVPENPSQVCDVRTVLKRQFELDSNSSPRVSVNDADTEGFTTRRDLTALTELSAIRNEACLFVHVHVLHLLFLSLTRARHRKWPKEGVPSVPFPRKQISSA